MKQVPRQPLPPFDDLVRELIALARKQLSVENIEPPKIIEGDTTFYAICLTDTAFADFTGDIAAKWEVPEEQIPNEADEDATFDILASVLLAAAKRGARHVKRHYSPQKFEP